MTSSTLLLLFLSTVLNCNSNYVSRLLTFWYLATFNSWLLLCPSTLSHDWQMGSLPLVTSPTDGRNIATALFFGCCLLLLYRCVSEFEVRFKLVSKIYSMYTCKINSYSSFLKSLGRRDGYMTSAVWFYQNIPSTLLLLD